jgi:hypothetical protein
MVQRLNTASFHVVSYPLPVIETMLLPLILLQLLCLSLTNSAWYPGDEYINEVTISGYNRGYLIISAYSDITFTL